MMHFHKFVPLIALALLLCAAPHAARAGQEPIAPYGKITDITGPTGSNPGCIAVTNDSPTHLSLMVPSLTPQEWAQFVNTTSVTGQTPKTTSPAGVSIAQCGCTGLLTAGGTGGWNAGWGESYAMTPTGYASTIAIQGVRMLSGWNSTFGLGFTSEKFSVPEGQSAYVGAGGQTASCTFVLGVCTGGSPTTIGFTVACSKGKAYLTNVIESNAGSGGWLGIGGSYGVTTTNRVIPGPLNPAVTNYASMDPTQAGVALVKAAMNGTDMAPNAFPAPAWGATFTPTGETAYTGTVVSQSKHQAAEVSLAPIVTLTQNGGQ